MISDKNKEIRITISKAQAKWLENTCKKAKISKSDYISWMLIKSATEMLKVLNQNEEYSNDEIREILKTNLWK